MRLKFRLPASLIRKLKKSGVPLLLFALYFAGYGYASVVRHLSFNSDAYDLAIFDNVLWNSIHGRPGYGSVENDGINHFAIHVQPVLISLMPAYFFSQNALILIVLQTFFLALGIFPVYWLAEKELGRKGGVVLGVSYLLYHAIGGMNLNNFHPVSLTTPFLLFAFYYLKEGRRNLFLLYSGLAMACKENIPLVTAFLGVYALITDSKGWRIHASLILISLSYFYFTTHAIIPLAGGGTTLGEVEVDGQIYDRYGPLGRDLGEVLVNSFKNPNVVLEQALEWEKILYLDALIIPFAYLPLISPKTLLISLPILMQNLLSFSKAQYMIGYQYHAAIIPFVLVSTVYAVKKLGELSRFSRKIKQSHVASVALLAVLFSSALIGWSNGYYPFLSKRRVPKISEHDEFLRRTLRLVPANVSVASQRDVLPHLSNRRTSYRLPKTADYVVIDLNEDTWPLTKEDALALVRELKNKGYNILFFNRGVSILNQ